MPTFGSLSNGSSFTSALNADQKLASKAVVTDVAYVQAVSVYLRNLGPDDQVLTPVVYDEVGGLPGNLRIVGRELLVPAGTAADWVTSVLDRAYQLNPGNYYVGVLLGPTGGGIQIGQFGGGSTYADADAYVGGASATFGVSTLSAVTLSIYATYALSVQIPAGIKYVGNRAGAVG